MRFILLVAIVLAGTVAWADIAPTPRMFSFHRIGLEILAAAGGGALLHALRQRKKDDDELAEECRSRVADVMPELKLRLKGRYDQAIGNIEDYTRKKLAEWLALCPDGPQKEEEKERYAKTCADRVLLPCLYPS